MTTAAGIVCILTTAAMTLLPSASLAYSDIYDCKSSGSKMFFNAARGLQPEISSAEGIQVGKFQIERLSAGKYETSSEQFGRCEEVMERNTQIDGEPSYFVVCGSLRERLIFSPYSGSFAVYQVLGLDDHFGISPSLQIGTCEGRAKE
jgi:hypothetical protein